MNDQAPTRLRILTVAESYPPQYGGGAAVVARDICRAVAGLGHEVRVLAAESRQSEPFGVTTEQDGPVRIDRVNLPYFMDRDPEGWQLGLLPWRRHERRIATFLDERLGAWPPDIVHYHTNRPFGEEGFLTIARHGIPILSMLHDAWLICPRLMLRRSPLDEPCSGPGALKCGECMYSEYDGSHAAAIGKLPWRLAKLRLYPAYRLWRRRAARRVVSAAIGPSQFIAGVHRPHLRGKSSFFDVGVDLEGRPSEQAQRPRSPFRFGFLGGSQDTKGVWDVLDAAAALKQAGFEFEVHVWGGGLDELESEIKARDLGGYVRLRGMFDRPDRWHVYDEIDLVINATTVSEPATRIPPEAAAAGAPSIGSRIGGTPEWIHHEENGLLYQFKSSDDLRRQMQRVLEEPGLYTRLRNGVSVPVDARARGEAVVTTYREVLNDFNRSMNGTTRPI